MLQYLNVNEINMSLQIVKQNGYKLKQLCVTILLVAGKTLAKLACV
jgi:hypothetical protein